MSVNEYADCKTEIKESYFVKFYFYLPMYMYVCVYVCVTLCHMVAGASRGQKRVSGPLELGFQAAVNGTQSLCRSALSHALHPPSKL